MTEPHTDPTNRQDFVLLFDVTNGNPNGDPDAGNLPRIDPETMHGLVTDVSVKRKIRDYVATVEDVDIFVQSETALNQVIEDAAEDAGVEVDDELEGDDRETVRQQMCQDYWDIRMFGAVLGTGINAGQVRGPVQVTFGRSIDPVVPLDMTITSVARRTEERHEASETEMGRKPVIPYGLYRVHGFVNPYLAEDTGVTGDDLELLWDALTMMYEFDRSASRGEMATRGLFVFSHDSKKGNAPSHKLFENVQVARRDDVDSPRAYDDYSLTLEEPDVDGVELNVLLK